MNKNMDIEYEAKFVGVDIDEFKKELKKAGAARTKERVLMKRCTLDMSNSPRGTFLRIRDEGDQITMTYKVLKSLALEGMQEVELVVDDFGKAMDFLKAIGAEYATYEENYRETYELDGIEIMIDEWPSLPAFVEVEGPSEKSVKEFANKFGLKMQDALFGNVDEVYKELKDMDISDCKEITFDNPPKN